MAKKRKVSRQAAEPSGPKEYDPKDARLGPINDYTDLADDQEQYFLDQDRIMFEDEPGTKRQKRAEREDKLLELSDDEVLADDDDDSDDDDDDDRAGGKAAKAGRKSKRGTAGYDDDEDMEDGDAEGEGEDSGWWGDSKKEYYDGEDIETEDHAREEEAEARRLQKKQLSRMQEADFFDADEWATGGGDEAEAAAADDLTAPPTAAVVKMATKTDEELDSMTAEEKRKLLRSLYPEIDHICDEFEALEPLLSGYQKAAEAKSATKLEVAQHRALACYLSTMAMYFSLLMSPTRDDPGGAKRLMDPEELHDHEVMQYLVDCRKLWERVKLAQARRTKTAAKREAALAEKAAEVEKAAAAAAAASQPAEEATPKTEKKSKAKKVKKAAAIPQEAEEAIAKVSRLLKKKKEKKRAAAGDEDDENDDDEDDDNGGDRKEMASLDPRTAKEKMERKKSMGFYTSQIAQKTNRRKGGAEAGGDEDIPYRERLRDRQARLTAAAVRRGQSAIQPGEELGGASDSEGGDGDGDDAVGKGGATDADVEEYKNTVLRAHQDKLARKAARQAEAAAGRLDRVEPEMWADEDGRRQLTWQIAKNKGLNHRTIKEKKNNPRVKKRLKFEKKKKQLASMRAVYKNVDPNKYAGETTGIKTGLVRSVKLD